MTCGIERYTDTMAQYTGRTVLEKDLDTIGFLYHGKRSTLFLNELKRRV